MTRPDPRFRCSGCNKRLGSRAGGVLTIEGPRMVASRSGVTITCPECRATKTWRPRITRRAVIHLGGTPCGDHD